MPVPLKHAVIIIIPMAELQRGWLNGDGHVVWENVFGYWAAYSPRYKTCLSACVRAQRYCADLYIDGDWQPLIASQPEKQLYASRYTLGAIDFYPVCNRSDSDYTGELIILDDVGDRIAVDIISGEQLTIKTHANGHAIHGTIREEGIAGVLIIPANEIENSSLQELLAAQQTHWTNADWTFTPWEGEHRNTELPHQLCQPTPHTPLDDPENMLPVPGFSGTMQQYYRMRECGWIADGRASEIHVYDAFEQDVRDEWQTKFGDFWMDRTPVTNQQFKTFIDATGYQPANNQRFLDHWRGGKPPLGTEDHPVVYVSSTTPARTQPGPGNVYRPNPNGNTPAWAHVAVPIHGDNASINATATTANKTAPRR